MLNDKKMCFKIIDMLLSIDFWIFLFVYGNELLRNLKISVTIIV